jgi:tripartite-type tricarboxylate transporter receptor subunit TctC
MSLGDAMRLARRKFLHLAAGAAALPYLPRTAFAKDAYPSRPVHMIVGFTPGAATDVVARMLSHIVGPILGQQIVVENRPGAGSSIAATTVAHSPADGYTVFLATLSIITNQIINPNASLDLMKDLVPVALLESGAVVLVVNSKSDLHSVADVVARAKAKPGEVLHSTVMGSLPHFASELFAQRAGIKLGQVPYQGSPQAVMDVVAGRAALTFSPASTVIGQLEAGTLRALGTAAHKRATALPNVPTMEEAGFPDFDTSLWFGLLAPAGTPRPIVEKLAAAMHKGVQEPEALKTLGRQGYDPLDAGPDKFPAFMRSEITRWTAVAKAAGIKS